MAANSLARIPAVRIPLRYQIVWCQGYLKLGAREPCAVHRECQPAVIAVPKNRRVQNINGFVIETFKNCAGKIFIRIDDQCNGTAVRLTIREGRRIRRRLVPKHQTWKIGLKNKLRAERRYE